MDKKKKYIIYSIILLLVVSLSVGFSAFQKQLLIDDSVFHVRLHEDVRVSDIKVQSSSENVVSNYEDFNVSKLYGSVNFPSANSYILYKLDLSNYGNLKSGLFSVTNNESGTSVQLCNSNGESCTSNFKTPVCNGNDCTLGATKEIYLKVSSSSGGNKMIDLDFDFEPYNTITYTNFTEDTSSFQNDIMSHDSYQITLTSKPEEVSIIGDVAYTYNKNTGVLNITDINSNIDIQARYLLSEIAQTSYNGSDPSNYVLLGNELYRIITKVEEYNINDELETYTKITRDSSIGNYNFKDGIDYMNDNYYSSLTNSQRELLEIMPYALSYFQYIEHDYNMSGSYVQTTFMYIDEHDFETSSSWLNKNQFTATQDPENILISSKKEKYSVRKLDKTIKDYSTKKMQSNYEYRYLAINNNELVSTSVNDVLPVYPSAYLTTATIVTGGNGTRSNPYTLSKSSNMILNNPTQVIAKDLKVTGSSQNLVTIKNQLGTVYFGEDYLDETNYTTGSTTIPTGAAVGRYTFYYYIPAIEGYKSKSGYIDINIDGLYYRVNYEKEEDVYSIGADNWGACTTTGTSLTCDVTLPNISDANGATVIGWSDGTNIFAPGSSYTLSSSGTTLTARVNLIHNYLNVTTNKYCQTLKGALSTVKSNETIKVLDNVIETQQSTLASSKTGVKFDINGKTLNINVNEAIKVKGEIDFYNSSSTEGKMIFVVSNNNTIISCEGKTTFNKTSSANSITFQASNSQATASNNFLGVWNTGTLEVYDNVNIIITGTNSVAISSSGTLIVEGGNISAQYNGILSRGPLTIGKKDSNVSITSPSIIATGSSGAYGIDSNNSTFNFYDGIVKSNSGSGKSISGTISEIPENYHMHKEILNGTESAYLLKDGYLMAGSNTSEDANYLRTNIAKQDIETITFVNSISGHTVNGTDCFDVSLDEDGTVLAWVTDTDSNGKYEVTIGADNKIYVSSGEFLFSRLINLTNINGIQYLDTSKATSLRAMFNYCNSLLSIDVSHFVTSNVTSFSGMFNDCSSLTSIDLSRFDTTKVTNMSMMFGGCSKLTSLNLTSFDTSKVTTMNGMFYKCIKLSSLDLSNFNTSNVTNMSNMFASTDSVGPMVLTQIIGIENFNTSNVIRMNATFQWCSNLTSLDLSGWNTSKVTNMSYMFYGCKRLTSLNVSHFDTSKVTNMKCMFYDCATLIELDISSFSTPLVTDMSYMFNRLWAIRTIYASDNFVTTSVTTSTYMFLHDEYLVGGSGTVYGGSGKSNAVYAHIDGGEANPGYFTDKNAIKATFYYNSNTTAGGLTVGTKIATCVPAEGQTSCTVTIPNSVTSSVGKYNSPYKGVSSSTSSMSTTSNLTINSNTTYYAVYSGQVTRYYYNNGYTSNTIYRNEFLTSNSEMSSVLSTSNTGTTNYTTSNGPGSSTFVGLSSAQDTTAEYNSVSAAANSADTTLYTVYQFSVSYEKANNVSSIGASSDSCKITTDSTSCSVILPSITPSPGYTSVGWSTTYGDTTGNEPLALYMLNSNNTILYANTVEALLMAGNNAAGTGNYLRTNIAKQDIESITFTNNIAGHTPNGTDCFDVSQNERGGVLAWVSDSDSNGKYEMTIASQGNVFASTGKNLFRNLTSLTTINGLEYLDISRVTDMLCMFYGCTSLLSLDLRIPTFDTSNVTTMESMFSNCSNITAIYLNASNFDTSNVTSMKAMFNNCNKLVTLDLTQSNFNTSKVTTMYYMFRNCNSLATLDLTSSNFDTSNVTDMAYMFYNCNVLTTLDLTHPNFDTSKVTNMAYMFYKCRSLTSLDLTHSNFDTSQVTNMSNMFHECSGLTSLNLTTSNFDTSNVTDMSYMFYYCKGLLTIDLTHLNFDTSNVTDMSYMFYNCKELSTIDLTHSNFNTSKVTNMSYMFGQCEKLTSIDLTQSNFDTSNVTDMSFMFYRCYILTSIDLSNFNTLKVTSMKGMFCDCSGLLALDLNHPNFNTSNVTDMINMFSGCKSITNLDLGFSTFDTSQVTKMSGMFNHCEKLVIINLDLSNFDTSNVTDMEFMFSECNKLKTLYLGQNFDTSKVTDMGRMFAYCPKLETIYVSSSFTTTSVTISDHMFSNSSLLVGGEGTVYDANYIDVSYARIDGGTSNPGYFTGIGGMLGGPRIFNNNSPINKTDVETITFQKTLGAPSGSIGSWDASFNQDNSVIGYYTDNDSNGKYEVTYTSDGYILSPIDCTGLFAKYTSLTSINNLDNMKTHKTTNMRRMFYGSKNLLTIDVSSFDTSNVTNMEYMFCGNEEDERVPRMNITSIVGLEYLDTSKVTTFREMFAFCNYLTSLNLSNFDTSSATSLNAMFMDCISLTRLDVSSFNTSKVTDMSFMFSGTEGDYQARMNLEEIIGLENFDTSNVTILVKMFFNCIKITSLNLSSFNTSKVTEMGAMFGEARLLTTIYASDSFVTTSVNKSAKMFDNCLSLVGGAGTVYDSSHFDAAYAHIDGGTSNPGYFTSSAALQNNGLNNSIMNGVNDLLNSIN